MAIVIKEQHQRSGSQDKDKRTYTRTWIVETDDTADDAADIFGSGSLPLYGAVHPSDTDARCKSVSCNEYEKKTTGGSLWTYTANYDTEVPEYDDPLDKPAEYSWDSVDSEEEMQEDEDGTPVLNSANDFFVDPVNRQVAHVSLSITKNVATFDGSLALAYVKKVNNSTFLGGPAGQVFCTGISANGPHIENEIEFWTATMSFLFDPTGDWQTHILDRGMREKSGSTWKPIYIDGKEITSPVLLDGSGVKLAADGTPVYLDFVSYGEADFSSLPIT